MDDTAQTRAGQVEYISLVDAMQGQWIKLPHAVMRACGPAAQTLGGLLKITKTETFCKTDKIARRAHLPLSTVRKHLKALEGDGWIKNKGREKKCRGYALRTATIALTAKARDNLSPYGVLPWWACGYVIDQQRKLSWGGKAVLSLVMSRLMSLIAAIEKNDSQGLDLDDIVGSIEKLGGNERFRMGLRWIERQTGLTRETIGHAKRELWHAHLICLQHDTDEFFDFHRTDILAPNWDAQIVVTPTRGDLVKLHVEEVSEDD